MQLRLVLRHPQAKPVKPKLPRWLLTRLHRPFSQPMAIIPPEDIRAGFQGYEDQYPPILTLKQAAKLAHVHPGSIKRWLSEGRLKSSVRPGKPLLFWRDRFVQEVLR